MFFVEDKFQAWGGTPSLWSYWTAYKKTYLPPELEPNPCTYTQQHSKVPPSRLGQLPIRLCCNNMWCSRSVLRRLQHIAATPLNITGAATGNMQRGMSTLPRVYVTRQIPPEGLKILRESGQWVAATYKWEKEGMDLYRVNFCKQQQQLCIIYSPEPVFKIWRCLLVYFALFIIYFE